MRLTRRGKIVVALLTMALIYFIVWVSGHIWWVSDHYCFNTMTECYMTGDK